MEKVETVSTRLKMRMYHYSSEKPQKEEEKLQAIIVYESTALARTIIGTDKK